MESWALVPESHRRQSWQVCCSWEATGCRCEGIAQAAMESPGCWWEQDHETFLVQRHGVELSQEGGNRACGGGAPQALWNSRYPTWKYRIWCCPDGVWSCFSPFIPCCIPVFSFWGVPQMDMPHPTGILCYYVIDLTWFPLIAGHKPDDFLDETYWKC